MTATVVTAPPPGPLPLFGVQFYPMRFMHSLALHRASPYCTGGTQCWHCRSAVWMADVLTTAPDHTLILPLLHEGVVARLVKKARLPAPEAHFMAGQVVWRVMGQHPFDAFRWVHIYPDGAVPFTDELQLALNRFCAENSLLLAFPGVPVVGPPALAS